MSNLVNRAAIMAPPPGLGLGQQQPVVPGTTPINAATVGNLVLVGGIMWVGGKAAAYAWDALGMDAKPTKKKKRTKPVSDEPEAVEDEEEEEEDEDFDDDEEEEEDDEDE
jgi:hypothetical protein